MRQQVWTMGRGDGGCRGGWRRADRGFALAPGQTRRWGVGLGLALAVAVGGATVGAQQVTLTLALREGAEPLAIYQDLVRKFEARNPGIRVQVQNFSSTEYDEKVLVALAAGVGPDVMYMHYSRFSEYAAKKLLLPLKSYMDADKFDPKWYFPSTIEQFTFGGRSDYAIPRETSSIALFYNKDLFAQAGLAEPDESWTYDQLYSAAKQLVRDVNGDGLLDQYGIEAPSIWYLRINTVWAFGGDLLDQARRTFVMNGEGGTRAIQWIADLIRNGVAPPAGNTNFQWRKGNVGMMFGGFWDILQGRNAGFAWDVAMLPKGPAGRFVRTATGGHAVLASTKYPEAAYRLARFLSSGEAIMALATQGTIIPAFREAAYSAEFLKGIPAHRRVFVDSLEYGRVDPVTTVWNTMLTQIDRALAPVWQGSKSAREALDGVKPAIDELLRTAQ